MRLTIFLAFIMTLLMSSDSFAQRKRVRKALKDNWIVLGSKNVSKRVEKDVLPVTAAKGSFKKLKIKVTGGKVYMRRMVVTYGNGSKDEIPLKFVFRRGAESRVIDLRGGNRIIKKITFVYDRKNTTSRAKVWVAGRR